MNLLWVIILFLFEKFLLVLTEPHQEAHPKKGMEKEQTSDTQLRKEREESFPHTPTPRYHDLKIVTHRTVYCF